ncbi:sulfatase-like hydrolase/transferase [Sunxiuqinia sp. A32]|uniref:sulfatase-like hydrolase/transferase n=1 Tax=Sunxiuqinia sp. A32 TaxID=3461496 RepID=UPI004045CF52
MNIRNLYSVVLFMTSFISVYAKDVKAKHQNPNIVIIVADDLGWGDVGFHGSWIKTPHLDKLSEEGVQLSRFYTAPVCSPTRAGLLTGMYPNRFGLRETVIPPWRDFGIDPSTTFLPEFLGEHGYKNRAIIGKWHLGHSRPEYYPLNNGFTHFYGHLNGAIDYFTHEREGELDWHNDYESSYDKGYSTDLIAEEAVRSIQNYSKEGPFFLYVAFNAPHSPLQAKTEDLKMYGFDESQPLYSKKEGKNAEGQGNTRKQTYGAMVTCMDRGIGNILQALDDLQIEENTLVLFFSDNGADEGSGGGSSGELRGHKFLEYDGGVRSPAIIRWPHGLTKTKQIDQLTGFVDVFPTICEIVDPGSSRNESFDGISILSALTDNKTIDSRTFYLGFGAVIQDEWKVIRPNYNPKMQLQEDVLYELKDDPTEETDLASKYPGVVKELVDLAEKFDTIKPAKEVLPFGAGRENFVAPKEWNIFIEK